MRKKDIIGNWVKNTGVLYSHSIKKLSNEFEGYSALINFLPESKELVVNNDESTQICLSRGGYKWLMYLPMNENWCITAFYNRQNEILQWYFDISKGNFLDENGIPCIDDIFLDLIIFPDGSAITIDADELQDALDKKEISVADYNHAYNVRNQILKSKWNNVQLLMSLSENLLSEYECP